MYDGTHVLMRFRKDRLLEDANFEYTWEICLTERYLGVSIVPDSHYAIRKALREQTVFAVPSTHRPDWPRAAASGTEIAVGRPIEASLFPYIE